jgi:hypothetical protein
MPIILPKMHRYEPQLLYVPGRGLPSMLGFPVLLHVSSVYQERKFHYIFPALQFFVMYEEFH